MMVLQTCIDMGKVLPGSYSKIFVTSSDNRNGMVNIKSEESTDVKEENTPIEFGAVKTEYEVSCMYVSGNRHTSPLLRNGYCFNHVHLYIHLVHLKQLHW